jgi:hypothetical protein
VGKSIFGFFRNPFQLPKQIYEFYMNQSFNASVTSAKRTGKALAEAIRNRTFGKATISLVGYSLGTRVVHE